MRQSEKAVEILRAAEEELASLLRDAVEAREYEDVAAIAQVSRRLHETIVEHESGQGSGVGSPRGRSLDRSISNRPQSQRPVRRLRRGNGGYPRFARDGDRLVKIGWSKKDATEYEHKAPRAAIDVLASALRSTSPGEFAMDDVLPLCKGNNGDVPSYQAYLVLAWLRSWGAVRKESRGGYVADLSKLTEDNLSQTWEALETRSDLTEDS